MIGFRNLRREGCCGRRLEAYTVLAHSKIFIYCNLGVAELKLERTTPPFGLAS